MKPVNWFILGFVLTVMEIMIPGFVIFWFGIAGVITGIIAIFIPNLAVQIPVFVVLSGIHRLLGPENRPALDQALTREGRFRAAERCARHRHRTHQVRPPWAWSKVLGETWRAEAACSVEVGCNVKVKKVWATT